MKLEVSGLTKQIISDKCNNMPCNHEVLICNLDNWLIKSDKIHLGQEKSCVINNGFIPCKRKDATHYALINSIIPEATIKTIWIKRTTI